MSNGSTCFQFPVSVPTHIALLLGWGGGDWKESSSSGFSWCTHYIPRPCNLRGKVWVMTIDPALLWNFKRTCNWQQPTSFNENEGCFWSCNQLGINWIKSPRNPKTAENPPFPVVFPSAVRNKKLAPWRCWRECCVPCREPKLKPDALRVWRLWLDVLPKSGRLQGGTPLQRPPLLKGHRPPCRVVFKS